MVESAERFAKEHFANERFELVDVGTNELPQQEDNPGLLGRIRRITRPGPIVPTHTVVAVTPVLFRFLPATLDQKKGCLVAAGEPRAYPRSQVDVLVPKGGTEINFILPNGTTEVLHDVSRVDQWPKYVEE
jgi:hypothetical protein